MDDVPPSDVPEIEAARKGMRSCLYCRTSFPNRLGLLKHETAGCVKAPRAAN